MDGRLEFVPTRFNRSDSTPYAAKPFNATFYVGGLWPSVRCGNPLHESARYFLVQESALHPDVLTASFGPPSGHVENKLVKTHANTENPANGNFH